MGSYFGDINEGIKTTLKGMQLTLRHLFNARKRRQPVDIQQSNYFQKGVGVVTLQYPHEKMQVPDNGRYQLDCEIDDCIVCDKCAKICPVDCIDIEAIKSPDLIGNASDGSPIRLYAGKFDIDMAKCCFCGLCTTVCPTECLTMKNEYDFSTFEVTDFTFEFSNLSPAEAADKKRLYEQFMAEKKAATSSVQSIISNQQSANVNQETQKPKPVFKPAFKKPVTEQAVNEEIKKVEEISESETLKPKPAFKPVFKIKKDE